MYKTIACWTVIAFGLLGHQASAQSAAPAALDYEFFKARVQPVFLAKRPGHARCVSCHGAGARLHPALVPLAKGANVWNDEDSRKNFAEFSRFAVPGSARSPLLRHPLLVPMQHRQRRQHHGIGGHAPDFRTAFHRGD